MLLVGTKLDLLSQEKKARQRKYSISQEFNCDSVNMVNHSSFFFQQKLTNLTYH